MIPVPSNEQLALAYSRTNPMPDDESLYEHIRILLGTGYSQTVTVIPSVGYILFITGVEVDNYPNATYNFVVGNITFDNTDFDRGNIIKFIKPMKVGEGDSVYIKVYNGETTSVKFNVVVEGWARKAEQEGGGAT